MYARFVYLGPTSNTCPRTISAFGFTLAEPSPAILTTNTGQAGQTGSTSKSVRGREKTKWRSRIRDIFHETSAATDIQMAPTVRSWNLQTAPSVVSHDNHYYFSNICNKWRLLLIVCLLLTKVIA